MIRSRLGVGLTTQKCLLYIDHEVLATSFSQPRDVWALGHSSPSDRLDLQCTGSVLSIVGLARGRKQAAKILKL